MFAIWTRLNFPPQYDEIAHQAFAQEIANHPGWSTLIDYEGARDYEAQGPLFFALLGAYGHWFGFALPILRTLTIVFAVLLAVSFAKLAEQLGYGASAISLICLPYFVILSTTAMTDVPCLALTVFAVYAFLAYTDSKSLFHLVVGVLASTAASYIRIDSLYVLSCYRCSFRSAKLYNSPTSYRFDCAVFLTCAIGVHLGRVWPLPARKADRIR